MIDFDVPIYRLAPPTQKKVLSIRKRLEKREQKLIVEKVQLQQICGHVDLEKRNRGDSGNWCKSDDSYWTEWKCQDCKKFWTTPQGIDHDRLWPHAKDKTRER